MTIPTPTSVLIAAADDDGAAASLQNSVANTTAYTSALQLATAQMTQLNQQTIVLATLEYQISQARAENDKNEQDRLEERIRLLRQEIELAKGLPEPGTSPPASSSLASTASLRSVAVGVAPILGHAGAGQTWPEFDKEIDTAAIRFKTLNEQLEKFGEALKEASEKGKGKEEDGKTEKFAAWGERLSGFGEESSDRLLEYAIDAAHEDGQKRALAASLGSNGRPDEKAGGELYEQLEKIQSDTGASDISPLFQAAMRLSGAGYGREEIPSMLRTLRESTLANQSGDAGFENAVEAFAEAKSRGHFGSEQLSLLESGAHLPISAILRNDMNLSSGQVSNIDAANLDGGAANEGILHGLQNRYGGTTADNQNDLPIEINKMHLAFEQLTTELGKDATPALLTVVHAITETEQFLYRLATAIPQPFRTALGWLTVLGTGVVSLVGIAFKAFSILAPIFQANAIATAADAKAKTLDTGATAADAAANDIDAPAKAADAVASGTDAGANLADVGAKGADLAASGILGVGLLGLAATVALAAVDIFLLVKDYKQYRDELDKPLSSENDQRSVQEKVKDEDEQRKIMNQVHGVMDDPNLDDATRYAVLSEARKAMGRLGAYTTDEENGPIDEIEEKRFALLKASQSHGVDLNADYKAGRFNHDMVDSLKKIDSANPIALHTATDMSGLKGNSPDPGDLQKQAADLQRQAEELQAKTQSAAPIAPINISAMTAAANTSPTTAPPFASIPVTTAGTDGSDGANAPGNNPGTPGSVSSPTADGSKRAVAVLNPIDVRLTNTQSILPDGRLEIRLHADPIIVDDRALASMSAYGQ